MVLSARAQQKIKIILQMIEQKAMLQSKKGESMLFGNRLIMVVAALLENVQVLLKLALVDHKYLNGIKERNSKT
jgi:hypothetical protein